jgi:hypothetical protein
MATVIDLAFHVKEMRDMQKAYFASRNGRYADRKLLKISKEKEKEIDAMIETIIAPASGSPDGTAIIDNSFPIQLNPTSNGILVP